MRFVLTFSFLLLTSIHGLAQNTIRTPSEFLGMTIGADRTLADYRQIVSYFRALDAASPRVDIESLGRTTLGEEMIMAVISSEQNIAEKARFKSISRRLADPRGLSAAEIEALAQEGKSVVLMTCNIHSTEIASSQMAMEWAHKLATATDAETRRRLDNVIILLVPSLNPDGQIMETEWYRKNLGSRYEGGRMPWLYHHYVGHDNNRDWFMLTQKETRGLTRMLYHDWFPQTFIDQHQMGATGPRMFIPPFSDPVDVDVHPLIWREINLIGTNMAYRLEQKEKAGVIYGYAFDAYWIGGTRNTGWWKNVTGLLLETASARMATPIYVDPGELSGGSKGLIDYAAQVNHPNPWKGGWWRMSDIMEYQMIASDAMHEVAADRRVDFLKDIARRALAASSRDRGSYVIPAVQRDAATAVRLAQLMADHGVEVFRSATGDYWIPLEQPYSRFVVEMLERQRYPEVRVQEGRDILRPYDVAAWSLPIIMGVDVRRTDDALPRGAEKMTAPIVGGGGDPRSDQPLPSGDRFAIDLSSPEAAKVVNSALRKGSASVARGDGGAMQVTFDRATAERIRSSVAPGIRLTPVEAAGSVVLKIPRVAIYKPWYASMDEGWTRFVLDQYGFEPKTLDNKTIAAGKLSLKYDAIILPSISKEVIKSGRPASEERPNAYFEELPADYRGGLDNAGAQALKAFVQSGGTLIAMGAANEYVIENFNVPVRNALAKTKSDEFSVSGSLLRVKINRNHPITASMPETTALFLDSAMAFETSVPGAEMERWVLASYPETADEILMSGWIRGEERLRRRAAAVAMTYEDGKIVMLGFRPQHRAQTHATFPFLFNSIYWSVMR